jgi:predicted ester cyclase
LDAIDQLFSPEFVRHGPALEGGDTRGLEGLKQLVRMYRGSFPDLSVPIDEQIAEGDIVVTRWTASGTQQGELLGMAPTGRPVTVPGILIDRVAGGRIAEEWASYDGLSMLQQLGATLTGLTSE